MLNAKLILLAFFILILTNITFVMAETDSCVVRIKVAEIDNTPQICYGGSGSSGYIEMRLNNEDELQEIKGLSVSIAGEIGIYNNDTIKTTIPVGLSAFLNLSYSYSSYGKIRVIRLIPKIMKGDSLTSCSGSVVEKTNIEIRNCSSNGESANSLNEAEVVKTTCTDSDGEDRFGRGVVKLYQGVRVIEVIDICADENHVREFTCNKDGSYDESKLQCEYGCKEGACSTPLTKNNSAISIQTVFINEDEIAALKEATLSYFVDCNVNDVGKVEIYFNNGFIASKIPDCGSPEKWQIDPKYVVGGKNELKFETQKGTYLFDKLMIFTEQDISRTKLKEGISEYPIAPFNLHVEKKSKGDSKNETKNTTQQTSTAINNSIKTSNLSASGVSQGKQYGSLIKYISYLVVILIVCILAFFVINKTKRLPQEKICQNCKVPIKEGEKYCPECGSKGIIMKKDSRDMSICKKCGNRLLNKNKFCQECGEKVK